MESDQIGTATTLLRAVASGDADLAARCVAPDGFVQHDPSTADGVQGLRERAARPVAGGLRIVRTIQDGDLVVAQGVEGVEVVFAVLRFENGRVAEQWRFATPAAPPNGSGHTQTDGPTEPDRTADTARVKALVRDYYETVHLGGRHDRIDRYMSDDLQIRHEPGVRDGVAAFKRDLEALTRSRTLDEIVLLAAEGDLVFLAARGTHQGRPCAYVDLYRVEADKLVEHWGFAQPAPPPHASRNRNGLL